MKIKLKTILALIVLFFAVTANANERPTLTVYTYDSLVSEQGLGPVIKQKFEAFCACKLKFIALDSSIGILGRLKLEGKRTDADVILGLDQNFIIEALETGLLTEHEISSRHDGLPIEYDHQTFVPFDWGYFAFVYNQTKLQKAPTSFEDILKLPDNIKIAIQDPRTSSPGFGLLLWIQQIYGDKAADYWQKLSPKILTVTKGWWDSYSLFLNGEADMVLSYASSPAYHMIVENNHDVKAADFAEGHYMQIEVAARTIKNDNAELANMFLSFIQSQAIQGQMATTNWMYPVTKLPLPQEYDATIKPKSLPLVDAKMLHKSRKKWIDQWRQALNK